MRGPAGPSALKADTTYTCCSLGNRPSTKRASRVVCTPEPSQHAQTGTPIGCSNRTWQSHGLCVKIKQQQLQNRGLQVTRASELLLQSKELPSRPGGPSGGPVSCLPAGAPGKGGASSTHLGSMDHSTLVILLKLESWGYRPGSSGQPPADLWTSGVSGHRMKSP